MKHQPLSKTLSIGLFMAICLFVCLGSVVFAAVVL